MPIAVGVALVGLFATAIGAGQFARARLPSLADLLGGGESTRAGAPVRIEIPSVDVRARVVGVGRAGDGSIAVPGGDPVRTAGWYELGPSPGDRGTAVIVGHVDTTSRPAVFARVGELSPGTKIEVTRRDRRVALFTVDSVSSYPKTAFPTAKVFSPTDRPRLVLVTCGGPWVGGDLGYADNVIVFATLARG